MYNPRIVGARKEGDTLSSVQIASAEGVVSELKSDAHVMCLGAYSPQWARLQGQTLRIYPAKGYFVTLPVINEAASYNVSLTDDEYKRVFSRLGNRLRIAGTAELNGYNTDLNLARCEAIVRRAPALSRHDRWATCAVLDRPAPGHTVQRALHRRHLQNAHLFLNTGHGTLGWTHACGSGVAIADIVSGHALQMEFAFTGQVPDRKRLSLGQPAMQA